MNPIQKLMTEPLEIVNVGLSLFYEDLKKRNIATVHIVWRPPAAGNKKLGDILKKIKSK
jgi:hypothetical protein